MKIVTSGLTFLDIDAYGGCVAYAELMNLQGEEAAAYSSAVWNESITKTIRSWDAPFATTYTPTHDDSFVLIDVSEPEYVDKVVAIDKVSEVIDHHTGYEDFWDEKLGDKANIEFIGAACTLVFEHWQQAGRLADMSETSARLLVAGILDNTLNFNAEVTTDRDKYAYEELMKVANLPDGWVERYFEECEESIFQDVGTALTNDTKTLTLGGVNFAFGQMVVWNGSTAVHEYLEIIRSTMRLRGENWFVNIASIADGKSFFLASSSEVSQWAEATLRVIFKEDIAIADRLWLRKEVIQQAQYTESGGS